jgi:hypothetical protein
MRYVQLQLKNLQNNRVCKKGTLACIHLSKIGIVVAFNIVTYRPIARQRLGKHIPAGANARNNRMPIARQRINKHAS